MTRKKYFSILMLFIFIMANIPLYADTVDLPTIEPFETNQIIVQYDEQLPELLIHAYGTEAGLKLEKVMAKKNLVVYSLNTHQDFQKALEKLNNKKGVVFAEPDYKLYQTEILPIDYFDLLWGFNNSNDVDINAPEAWSLTEGSSQVVVAVIDTGVQIHHLDLEGQFVTGYDFYEDNTSVYDGTFDDHGTHVSGTIAALKDNNGVVGVAPLIKIMPLKFLGPDGGYTSDAIDAIYYAKANGASIINASWGGGSYSQALKDAIEFFGGPFVAAAGNSRLNTDRKPHYPSSYTSANIISVAAVTDTGLRASFSNYGLTSVDVGAPGVDIASTYPSATLDGYAYMSGTSMAAPHVTGTLALMMSYAPGLTTADYIQALFDTVKPLDSLAGKTVTGGMIDAYQALLALNPPIPDTTPPVIVSYEPMGSNVSISPQIKITFDENILEGAEFNNITLTGDTFVSTQTQINGNILEITPDAPLAYVTDYIVNMPSQSVTDLYGNISLETLTFSFTTESEPLLPVETVQVVASVDPVNKARNVPLDQVFTITLNETIASYDLTKIHILDKSLVEVPFAISEGNNTFVLLPESLVANMRYTITLEIGAFTTATNYLSDTYTWVISTTK